MDIQSRQWLAKAGFCPYRPISPADIRIDGKGFVVTPFFAALLMVVGI
jgi:hypothetical protein